LINLQDTKYYC